MSNASASSFLGTCKPWKHVFLKMVNDSKNFRQQFKRFYNEIEKPNGVCIEENYLIFGLKPWVSFLTLEGPLKVWLDQIGGTVWIVQGGK